MKIGRASSALPFEKASKLGWNVTDANQKSPKGQQETPNPYPEPVRSGGNGEFSPLPADRADTGDDLVPANPRLRMPLMVSAAGVGPVPADRYDPVQNVLTVIPAVKGKIIPSQRLSRPGKCHLISAALQGGLIAGSGDCDPKSAAGGHRFPDQRIDLREPDLLADRLRHLNPPGIRPPGWFG